MAQMTFVPLGRREARILRDTGTLAPENGCGCAATPSLMAAHSFDASMTEDAEYAALAYAGAQALVCPDTAEVLRLVLAADLQAEQTSAVEGDPYGQVDVRVLRWADVVALFADESEAAEAVARARRAAAGATLAEALDLDEVETLLDAHDLLWFAPDELDELPEEP